MQKKHRQMSLSLRKFWPGVLVLLLFIAVSGYSAEEDVQEAFSSVGTAIPDDQAEDARRVLLSPSHKRADKKRDKTRPLTCTKEFPPQCDMYPYVRFWNKEFHAEDCYESPLRTGRNGTPWDEQKYVVFQPDVGGWNNIRMGAETVIIFAHATGRTLVLPPMMKFYLLNKNQNDEENQSNFQKFFDFKKISEGMNIISMEEFVENVAKKGLLEEPFPNGLAISQKKNLWNYMGTACHMPGWRPDKRFVGLNISASNPEIIGAIKQDEREPRFHEMRVHGRTLLPFDKEMDAHRALFFPGEDASRMLVHYYAYLYWSDAHTEQIYKRIVRDRLHYHDDIFCAAGKVVKLLHADAAALTGKPVQSAEAASPKTLGGDTNRDATYFAFHIRRGDFQYFATRLSAEELWANTKHLLDPTVTTLIYIATDEQNKTFFAPFMQPPYTVKFLDSYLDLTPRKEGTVLNLNHVGMMEQVICANAHTFIGTPFSTFTGYITRMRGYYRDRRYDRSFYTIPGLMYDLQKKPQLTDALWGREFAKAHTEVDDYWQ